MDTERFFSRYPRDPGRIGGCAPWSARDTRTLTGTDIPPFTEFFANQTSASVGGGILRWALPGGPIAIGAWNGPEGWPSAWPQFSDRLRVFAYDWLGRQFGFDLARREVSGVPMIAMLDPGAGELLEIPVTFEGFIESETIDEADACLAASLFDEWLRSGRAAPSPTECIGYSRPLFVGGKDDFSNLEKTDLDVYVTMCGQLFAQT